MGKVEITKTEAIPFRDENGVIIQMKQYEISVTVNNEGTDETIEELEKQLEEVFKRNYEKVLGTDPIYQKQKRQLTYLYNELKRLAPTEARKIYNNVREIK